MDIIDRINLRLSVLVKTGADMSRDLDLSNSTYSQWNTRKTKPSNKTLAKIAPYLQTTVEYLLLGDEEPAPKKSISEEDLKLALFGGAGEVTEEMWQEATFAIELIKQRHQKKKDQNG